MSTPIIEDKTAEVEEVEHNGNLNGNGFHSTTPTIQQGHVQEADEFDELDDHDPVSGAEVITSEAIVEEPEVGSLGAPATETEMEMEFVPGYETDHLNLESGAGFETVEEDLLLDAWHAEFSDPGMLEMLTEMKRSSLEVVIGADDRIRITGTTSYPWRAICSLRVTAADNSRWIGTGWLVGPGTVITAGHVIYMHSRGGWAKSVEVIPGRNASNFPYGSTTVNKSRLRSVKGWVNKRKRSHDYGAIILPSNRRYGNQLGYFGYGYYSSGNLNNLTVNLSGYPGDKPAGTQWFHARKIKDVNSRSFSYNIDTAGGQSGSPVWWLKNGKRYAVGIHTNGSSSGNSATRIVKPVFENIKKWKAQGG